MSAHVLFEFIKRVVKSDIRRGLPSILSLFHSDFNKFNNTEARMLDSIYPTTIKLLEKRIFILLHHSQTRCHLIKQFKTLYFHLQYNAQG